MNTPLVSGLMYILFFFRLFTWGNSFSRFAAFRYNKVVDEDTVVSIIFSDKK